MATNEYLLNRRRARMALVGSILMGAAALAIVPPASAQETAGGGGGGESTPIDSATIANLPLFASHDILELTLIADFKQLRKDRKEKNDYRPAQLVLPGGDTLKLKVRTRGNFRLNKRNCNFPPLRLNFKPKETEGTVFENQDKVKLVAHCQDKKDEYEQYVLQEYLLYRVYNVLSPMSFRTRLTRMTYIDPDDNNKTLTKYGFLIEDEDHMATRSGWQHVTAPVIPPDAVDPEQMMIVEVFHYMIANTDWDPFMAEPDEDKCCHNQKPIGTPVGPIYTIPYDFDWAGVINTRYAKPNQSLGLRSVRDRQFRGLCRAAEQLQPTFDYFNARKNEIYGVYDEVPELEEKIRKKTIEFYDKFFETINDPKKIEREFVRKCRHI